MQIYCGSFFVIDTLRRHAGVDKVWLRASIIARKIWLLYIIDIMELVSTNVVRACDTRTQELEVNGDDEDFWISVRRTSVKAWSAIEPSGLPLAFGENNETRLLLVKSLLKSQDDMDESDETTLPPSAVPHLSLKTFVQEIYNMGRLTDPESFGAPLIQGGSCQGILRIGIKYMTNLLVTLGRNVPVESRVVENLMAAAQSLQITVVPNSPPQTGRGRRIRWPRYDTWTHIDSMNNDHITDVAVPEHMNPMARLRSGVASSACDNKIAPWSFSDTTLLTYHKFLDKEVLTTDWDLSRTDIRPATCTDQSKYVLDTYDWAQAYFNKNLRTSQDAKLAIHMAYILTMAMPHMWSDDDEFKARRSKITGTKKITEAIRALPYIKKPRGGLTDQTIYFTQLLTYFLAMTIEDSPLRMHIQQNNNSIGEPWTRKHGK